MNKQIVALLGLLIASACSRKSSAPAEAPAPENVGPATLSAAAFDAQYRSLEGLELLNKYSSGVILTGSVKNVIEEEDKSLKVWVDASGGKWISLSFTDQGAAAKAKGLKAGSAVKATCGKVLGSADRYIMVGDCTLG